MKPNTEIDPYDKPSGEPGAKLDAGKAPILRGCMQYFPRAIEQVSMLSLAGAEKYSWKGWEHVPDGVHRYGDALCRHLIQEETDGMIDKDTGLLHATAVAWNALARLELILREHQRINSVGSIEVSGEHTHYNAQSDDRSMTIVPPKSDKMLDFMTGNNYDS